MKIPDKVKIVLSAFTIAVMVGLAVYSLIDDYLDGAASAQLLENLEPMAEGCNLQNRGDAGEFHAPVHVSPSTSDEFRFRRTFTKSAIDARSIVFRTWSYERVGTYIEEQSRRNEPGRRMRPANSRIVDLCMIDTETLRAIGTRITIDPPYRYSRSEMDASELRRTTEWIERMIGGDE